MYKRAVLFCLILVAACVWALPVINLAFLDISVYKQALIDENATAKKVLFSTDYIEGFARFYLYSKYGKTFDDNVIAGKDGYFFLGNYDSNVLDVITGKYKADEQKINEFCQKLLGLQSWYESVGIEFLLVLAPNKHSIYKDKLPDNLQYGGENNTDIIIKTAKSMGIKILDLRPVLLENKDKMLYCKTDTHWNNRGALIAYNEIIAALKNKITTPKYEIQNTKVSSGDLIRISKMSSFFKEYKEDDVKIVLNDDKIKACDIIKGVIDCSKNNNDLLNVYIKNDKAANELKLLYIADSFSFATSKLVNHTFKEIYKIYRGKMRIKELKSFVETNKPDIAIYQIVERNFFDKSLIK